MKHNILFALSAAVLLVGACNLDLVPSDSVSSSQMTEAENAETATNGNYALFKACLPYKADYAYTGNSYIRHYFEMSEFRGDNMLISATTSDPLQKDNRYEDSSTDSNLSYFWFIAYKIVYGTNSLIGGIPEGSSDALDQLLGENYFMRAVANLHLSTLFSLPYSYGRDNPGIVLRTSTDWSTTERSTVGEVYDQIRDDLIKAAELLKGKTRRGNNGYASYEAAMGLLSRVYLYREENQLCIDTVNELLGGAEPSSKLDSDYENLFQFSKTSSEVLWCIGMTESTNDFISDQKNSSMGSMFYAFNADGPAAPGTGGWGEIYYSQPLMDLFGRYPEDVRFSSMSCTYMDYSGETMVYWPVASSEDYRQNFVVENPSTNTEGKYVVTDENGNSCTVETETVNGYERHYILQNGEKTYVSVSKKMPRRSEFPIVYMKKFANMDGGSNCMSSPAIIRWAEVILNRAEAEAKLGQDDAALADVNVIRTRAGLSGSALFSTSDYASKGYDSVLDVVLDERWLELCFEGHRAIDQFRNKRDIDRRFAGFQPYAVVSWQDPGIIYQIPFDETSVSGIPQNER